MGLNPDVAELYNYNRGLQWTHLGDWATGMWIDRPTACGRRLPRKVVTHVSADVDCPSCLRATPGTIGTTNAT